MNHDIEIWSPISGFQNYQVSNLGRVKSLGRTVVRRKMGPKYISSRILKPVGSPYLHVAISDGLKSKSKRIHILVAEAFLGPRQEGVQVNHKNCNKTDNRACNLEYVSPVCNTRHAIRNGRFNHAGSKNGGAKLNESKVTQIKALLTSVPRKEIACLFSVSEVTIYHIQIGHRWKHVS